jgi:acetyl/propionyl-CoA carboxylase alpha subunit/acetyl-CoA carboxylase carboxyltransferase component
MPARPLRRVLIANRGEIAIRIARAAHGLGIETVSVAPAADEHALHTRVTTTTRRLHEGRSPSGPSDGIAAYLDIGELLRIAAEEGCDAVHPGYGFLAEHARFAEACRSAGIAFVGPAPELLALFGDKVRARELARSLGVPVAAGSSSPAADVDDATAAAETLGWPVMLKAAAGGGGRGMREVRTADAMADAFRRASSEAAAAFGDGRLFVERLMERPRHLEVQILGDGTGALVHLHERDCSVQLRHQKVVEIAPAVTLDPAIRERLLADAVAIGRAVSYANAGTVEFLVVPETGEHVFIECNPRIQVEHTVTEQVTGTDLVEAQFRIAAGATLADLGLATQSDVPTPRGVAVQVRVVATGPGTITAHQAPSGAGIRVDGSGYTGYAPSPQFDPLLAKVIASAPSLTTALDRADAALAEYLADGLPTNLDALRAILRHDAVRSGDARTTLLAEHPELAEPPTGDAPPAPARAFLAEQARALGHGAVPANAASAERSRRHLPVLEPGDGEAAARCPAASSVLEVCVTIGERVSLGAPIVVLSAMKMETVVPAPCAGIVTSLLPVAPGDLIDAGTAVALIAPDDQRADGSAAAGHPWASVLGQIDALRDIAARRLAPGSTDPGVVRQRSRGKLTCRERIDELLDDGSFREVGSVAGFATLDDDGSVAAFTPANHVGGTGRIEQRTVVVCADDFTSRGGHADGAIGSKSLHLDRLSTQLRIPSIRLLDGSSGGGSVAAMVPEQQADGERTAKESRGAITAGRPRVSGSGGSFLPGHLGSTDYTEQLATVPVVNVLLGSVVGIGAAKAVLGHFSVMVRDISQLFVAGPPVVRHAMGYDVTKEDLGGWHIHCRNGSVDNLAETEQEALGMARRFLSYLPSSVYEAPPVVPPGPSDPADRADDELLTLIPRKRTTTFDVRRAIELIVDRGSFFEIGPLWGTDQVTGLVRCNGHAMGVIASDSRHVNGGALTADGCDKLRRLLDLCDLFHLPVLNLVDNPGFAVGIEHEIAGTIRRGGEWMVAFAQLRVPVFTVIMRRSFGVAGNNWATPSSRPSVRVAWPSADVGGIPPEGGIEAAYKRQLAEAADPVAFRAELEERIERARGPIGPLNRFQMEEMIDPRSTRRLVCEWLERAAPLSALPAALGPRPIGFRP